MAQESCAIILPQFIAVCVIALMTLVIKRIHNLPPYLSHVSTLPGITQKRKSYVVFLLTV